jgi:hypothetical protein
MQYGITRKYWDIDVSNRCATPTFKFKVYWIIFWRSDTLRILLYGSTVIDGPGLFLSTQ